MKQKSFLFVIIILIMTLPSCVGVKNTGISKKDKDRLDSSKTEFEHNVFDKEIK